MLRRFAILALVAALPACDGSETDTETGDTDTTPAMDAYVVVTGAPYLQVGSSMSVTATTVGGDAETYTYVSSDDLLATVDADGVVAGHSSGIVVITATGDTSGEEGELGIFVQNEIPNFDDWVGSAHADVTAEAFNHWNEDGEVPTSCARCHSTPGYQDYIGADGSEFGVVDAAAEIGTVIECVACHNDATDELDMVIFPSGVEVHDLGAEARCMTCHQGRASTDSVDEKIATAAVDDDTVSSSLSFQNIHYYAAGATLYAGRVRGGYQYASETYDWRFRHVPPADTCVECHSPHSLEVQVDLCATCHEGVTSKEDIKDVRMMASLHNDYDGDGDRTEGMFYEIAGMRDRLIAGIQAYTVDKGLSAVCYDSASYPYWFQDTDGNGACSESEADFANAYAQWTPRLVRAAYNYQVSLKDPGAHAHNAKYIIQLLHDSTTDVNDAVSSPVDLSALVRNDVGHFNGAGEPARHWDGDEEVSSGCARCHGGAEGFRFFLDYGVGKNDVEQDNGLDCATCHDNFGDTFDVVAVDSVTFPGGKTISNPGDISNVCMTCHQGRVGKADIDDQIATGSYRFLNVHYLPAGGTKQGTNAQVGYEYDGRTYAGPRTNHLGGEGCINCHDPVKTEHTFAIEDNFATCKGCHVTATDSHDIRGSGHALDYDGDGSASEPLAGEIEGLADGVLAAMQDQARICYNGGRYPYWFADTDGDGVCGSTETGSYSPWTPALMKAAHNYQISQKEPGAWAHNFNYMGELLYDSIEDLAGGTGVSSYTRP